MFLLMSGCIPIGYAYPTVSYVGPTPVGAPRDEVRAFRVDVADDDNSPEFPEKDEYVLQALPIDRDGQFDAQVKVAVDYGWVWNWIALIYNEHTHHTMLVRLYRPGYQTVEIESWQKSGKVKWVAAPTPADQERAIDDLLTTWNTAPVVTKVNRSKTQSEPPTDATVFRYLAPGSTSDQHLQALQFFAQEYERLQRGATDKDVSARLGTKAKALRMLAAK
jgi:hypothetical protein